MTNYDELRDTMLLPIAHDPGWRHGIDKVTGYGFLKLPVDSRTSSRSYVHVVTCELVHGPRPPGLIARHSCRNRACYWAEHLVWGTRSENNLDMIRDGTMPLGEQRLWAKLTDAQALEIRARYKPYKVSLPQLAAEYGVSAQTIWRLVQGRTFKHLLS